MSFLCSKTCTFVLLVLSISSICFPCSTFLLSHDDQHIFGNNYDWDLGDGLVVVNKRDVAKTAINYTNPVSWVSKYGSVTFNQYGREFPTAGMNEAGLTIGLMWLSEAEYPPPDGRPEIDNLQWIQYLLDNFTTVGEVIADDAAVRVAPLSTAAIHYLIADAQGGCAAIEFIGGTRVVFAKNDMPATVLTNSTYAESRAYLSRFKGFGGVLSAPGGNESLERVAKLATMILNYTDRELDDAVNYGFDMLSHVSMGSYTKWSIVYDIHSRCIYFKTAAKRKIKSIALKKLDFSCEKPTKIIDINTGSSGDITKKLVVYTPKKNKKLVRNTFRRTYFLKNTPEELVARLLRMPEGFTCKK